MTIKNAHMPAALALSMGIVVAFALPASAQDTLPSPTASSGQVFVPAATPVAASAAPTGSMPSVSTPSTMPSSAVPGGLPVVVGGPGAVPGVPGAAPKSNLLESPVTPQVVTDAVTGLQKTDPINLDDMIRAQDAINRLDLMLEIEKRQGELKKLRDERTKPASSPFSSPLPASALDLPPVIANPAPVKRVASNDDDGDSDFRPSSSSSGSLDKYSLKRITGSNGRYAAVLANGDRVESVRQGDTLTGDVKVKSVNLTEVTLVKGKKSKTLTIPSDSYIVRETSGITK